MVMRKSWVFASYLLDFTKAIQLYGGQSALRMKKRAGKKSLSSNKTETEPRKIKPIRVYVCVCE